jgi:hypothetical protein
MKRAIFIAMALVLAACHRSPITCRSEYLYPPYLASVQVNTPDPMTGCFLGQQVIVKWDLPRRFQGEELTLLFHIRFGNREQETLSVPINSHAGWWVYRLMNADYECKGGILSFQAQIIYQDAVVAEWNHYLWAEIIHVS